MKAISLWQPWATALFIDLPDGMPLKPDETRHWEIPHSIQFGETVAIHAAKRDTPDERQFWGYVRPSQLKLFEAAGVREYADLPRGAIIGTLEFRYCKQTGLMTVTDTAMEWGNYSDGRFAWGVTNRKLLPTPVSCIGRQGFFDWDPT